MNHCVVKFPVIVVVVVYVASSLVNKDEYIIYYAYTSVQSVISLLLIDLVVAFVFCLYLCLCCFVFTGRCYASAVLAMGLCLSVSVSVSVSVCHKSEFY